MEGMFRLVIGSAKGRLKKLFKLQYLEGISRGRKSSGYPKVD